MTRLCTICARGGSKGVPRKNIRLLHGKPLIAWTIEQALSTEIFEHVAVSSDDPEILEAARQAGADLLIHRPQDLASDSAAKVPSIRHALLEAERITGKRFVTLVDLDVTSPLRHVSDIVGAVSMLEHSGRSNIITGCDARRSPYFNLVEQAPDQSVALSKQAAATVTRRQDSPPTFDMNASIYVWNRDRFLEHPAVFYSDTGIFVMPQDRSQDIDTELDFQIVELFLDERVNKKRPRPTQTFDLSNRIAVVTGAAGLLGVHFCQILAEHGARVVALDKEAGVTGLPDCISQFYALDVSDPDQVRNVVAQIERDVGPVDILHNNAASKGADLARFFDDPKTFDPEIWRSVMSVNVDGYFFMAREIGTLMAERGRGSIVQTGSIYGMVGPDQRIYEGSEYLGMPINTPAVYAASKAAVIGLTRYFATYWGHRGVRVNTLTPGGVGSGQNREFDRMYSSRVPLGRMGSPEDMANGLLFLASDASKYVTGHNLVVDGGLTAW